MRPSLRLAVIGGGLSGLAAAYYLHRAVPEAELLVLEAEDHTGGVIATERRDGWLIEHGADCFSTNPPDALQLCRDLGVEGDLIEPEPRGRRAMISRGKRLVPVPEGFVLMRPTRMGAVLRTPLLSWRGKCRLLGERFVKPRRDDADESLASFVRRRFGREVLDRLVQPLVAGIYTADAEQLSMQATMPQFVKMEREHGSLIAATLASRRDEAASLERASSGARYGQFRVFPEGMGRLFEELMGSLPPEAIQFNAPLKSLARESDGRWRLRIEGRDELMVDGVLLAVSAPVAASLLDASGSRSADGAPLARIAADELAAIPYASSAVVVLGVETSKIARLPDAFGFVVPAVDRRRILAGSFASHKFPGRTPPGRTLIRVFIGGALQPELLEQDDARLIEIAREELGELVGLSGEPELSIVRRWTRAMPQYHVGHRQRVERIEAELEKLPGLEIAGNALHGVGIAPVVGTARRAAERLVAAVARG
ncbi:protoporphyrinogen oxidase [Candidatus Laterigemmans baculatus]|uniref:protoporphyrinogen oxidase n=1 Tax=Candidatus Laterigemmans baculatus TaxID=2770505 RepID=UPI0013DB7BC1|nr:protoporphyrinogen oxidase [Candidatus Laterigemmans baculatus]